MNDYATLSETELIERLQAMMPKRDQTADCGDQDYAERLRLIAELETRSDDWHERLAALVRQRARDARLSTQILD